MKWDQDGRDWPNAEASRFVASGPHVWHVQRMGAGPTLLLLHGAGASTHSWRQVAPALAKDFDVISVDLPGQGFTGLGSRSRCGLEAMAEDLAALMKTLKAQPSALVGHSAGAAIAMRLAQLLDPQPLSLVALNGAFEPFRGVAGFMFPMAARFLAMNPFAGFALSRMASNEASVRALVMSTGSRLDDDGVDLYRRLVSDAAHVDATIAMMARWDLDPVLSNARKITTPALLIAAARDAVVPPKSSRDFAEKLVDGRYQAAPGYGHLHHEEAPEEVVDAIRAHLAETLPAAEKRRPARAGAARSG